MKIIDWEKKGNVVRFYLGKKSLKKYYGDDWNDAPYEHNAGQVYDDYVLAFYDVFFDFNDVVLEPCDGTQNTWFSKEDFQKRKSPIIIVIPKSIFKHSWDTSFSNWVNHEKVIKIYMEDPSSVLDKLVDELKCFKKCELIEKAKKI